MRTPRSPGLNMALPKGAARVAVAELGRRIVNDIYLPGELIPTEAELAESLNVSRTTVRDAIKVLSGKGMVRTARRYGTRIRPIEEWNLLDADVVEWHNPSHPRLGQMFAETTELRCVIEPAAAEMAATRATSEQVQAMMSAAYAMHPGDGDVKALFDADCLFHGTMLEATGNMMMRQLKPVILTVLRVSYEFGVLIVDGKPVDREGHIFVAEAIRAGDGTEARRQMNKMLSNNRRVAERYWKHRPAIRRKVNLDG